MIKTSFIHYLNFTGIAGPACAENPYCKISHHDGVWKKWNLLGKSADRL